MTNFNPKVSIVIPVYNGANYLREAIDSALAQTYKNCEVLVINDGSTDEGATDAIARSYGEKIRYFVKENGGVSTALNLGIREMTGEYFSWLSHDDVYYPDKVEKQINYLACLGEKDVLLYSDHRIINEKSRVIGTVTRNNKMLMSKPEYGVFRGCVNGITALIPRKAFEECGFFDEKLRCSQDYVLWFEMMKKYKFIHMPQVLAKYRSHQMQDTNISPNFISEGNDLWINMMNSVSTNTMIKLEGSEFEFYKQMVFFLRKTPYRLATDYANKKANYFLKENNKPEIDFTKTFVFPEMSELKNKIRFAVLSPIKFIKKYLSKMVI